MPGWCLESCELAGQHPVPAPRRLSTPQSKPLDEQARCITSLNADHVYRAEWAPEEKMVRGLLSSAERPFATPRAISGFLNSVLILNYLSRRYSFLQRDLKLTQTFIWESINITKSHSNLDLEVYFHYLANYLTLSNCPVRWKIKSPPIPHFHLPKGSPQDVPLILLLTLTNGKLLFLKSPNTSGNCTSKWILLIQVSSQNMVHFPFPLWWKASQLNLYFTPSLPVQDCESLALDSKMD